MRNTTKKAFTLIELLVVITIIGILATGAVSIYTSQIQKARDTTRINDIKALQGGIEQFYQDNTVYPRGGEDFSVANQGVQSYVPKLAQDPKHNQTCIGSRCGYIYAVGTDANGIERGAYEISTSFENKGNHDNKAKNDSDNGNDTERLELGLRQDNLDTSHPKDTAFNGTQLNNSDTSTVVVIVKGGVIQK